MITLKLIDWQWTCCLIRVAPFVLMTLYREIDLGQHYFRKFAAWWPQAITLTNFNSRLLASILVQFHRKYARYGGVNYHLKINLQRLLHICLEMISWLLYLLLEHILGTTTQVWCSNATWIHASYYKQMAHVMYALRIEQISFKCCQFSCHYWTALIQLTCSVMML